jgi:hypothetical protein
MLLEYFQSRLTCIKGFRKVCFIEGGLISCTTNKFPPLTPAVIDITDEFIVGCVTFLLQHYSLNSKGFSLFILTEIRPNFLE